MSWIWHTTLKTSKLCVRHWSTYEVDTWFEDDLANDDIAYYITMKVKVKEKKLCRRGGWGVIVFASSCHLVCLLNGLLKFLQTWCGDVPHMERNSNENHEGQGHDFEKEKPVKFRFLLNFLHLCIKLLEDSRFNKQTNKQTKK